MICNNCKNYYKIHNCSEFVCDFKTSGNEIKDLYFIITDISEKEKEKNISLKGEDLKTKILGEKDKRTDDLV